MGENKHDVIVVGAGIAGLACAQALTAKGLDVVVLERSDRVGGRVTSDQPNGFIVDRGFQVLNPAYPHLRGAVDMSRLGMRKFPRQVRVLTDNRLVELSDPSRRPDQLLSTLRSGLVQPKDAALLTGLARPLATDRTRGENFDAAGFTGPLRHQVIDPFLAGVVCERDQSTSARFTSWLLAMFAADTPGLPSGGMRTLPRIMAEGLDVRLGTAVQRLNADTGIIETTDGEFAADAVVLAAGPQASARLSGEPAPQAHGTSTFWFATDQAASDTAAIHLDGSGTGPVATTTVVSNLAPEYAPAGQHLVAALTLPDPADGDCAAISEDQVRQQLGRIYQTSTLTWRLIARHDLPETVPALPPHRFRAVPQAPTKGRIVTCGDQLGNASLDGAAASGHRAAVAAAAMVR